jgi:hypothetical protein
VTRQRDPRRVIERRRRARARVNVIRTQDPGCAPDGSVGSRQLAEVTVPRAELQRLWSAEYLERLARTYWRFLSRISLGLLRVLYTEHSREVVILTRPFVVLRFKAPEYDLDRNRGTVTWPIERGLLVAKNGRGRGYLRLSVERPETDHGESEVTVTVSSEVVNFYPRIAAGIGQFIYDQTQARLHRIVTNAFLRSLANLEFEPSMVGALSPASPPRSPAASPGRGEP